MPKRDLTHSQDYQEEAAPLVAVQAAKPSGSGGAVTVHSHADGSTGGLLTAYARLAVAQTISAIWTFLSGKLRVGGGTAADQDLLVVHKDDDSEKAWWDESEDSFALTKGLDVVGSVDATTVTGANVTTGADPGHTHTVLPAHDHSGDAGDGLTFDAANLTSGAATDNYALVADGAGGAAWEAVVAGAIGDHAHAGVVGDGGTFDGTNLTSGAATDGYGLLADGAGGAAWEAIPGGAGGTDVLMVQVFG